MEILIIALYVVLTYLALKFIKKDWIEMIALIAITMLLKFLIKDGSFYPLFAMPVLLSLRYNKPYSIIYLIAVCTFVSLFEGFGVWTIGQYAIFAIIAGVTYLLKNVLLKNKLLTLSYNFVSMFLFGVFMDVFTFFMGNFLGYANVFEQIINGIPFDLKYGLSGLLYGSITMVVAYIASVDIKEILKVKKMSLVKVKENA